MRYALTLAIMLSLVSTIQAETFYAVYSAPLVVDGRTVGYHGPRRAEMAAHVQALRQAGHTVVLWNVAEKGHVGTPISVIAVRRQGHSIVIHKPATGAAVSLGNFSAEIVTAKVQARLAAIVQEAASKIERTDFDKLLSLVSRRQAAVAVQAAATTRGWTEIVKLANAEIITIDADIAALR